jgi:hypothetical protein
MYYGQRTKQVAHLSSNALSEIQTAAAYAVFLVSYLVFALGKFPGMKIDRPGAAIIGAVLLFAGRVWKGNIFGSLCPSPADAARRNGTGQVENLKGQVMPLRGWPEIESTLLGISLPHGRSALRRMLGPQQ